MPFTSWIRHIKTHTDSFSYFNYTLKNHWMNEDIRWSRCCRLKTFFNEWIFIDREAREIMYLVASVRPSVCPSICPSALSHYQSKVFVCVPNSRADAADRLLITHWSRTLFCSKESSHSFNDSLWECSSMNVLKILWALFHSSVWYNIVLLMQSKEPEGGWLVPEDYRLENPAVLVSHVCTSPPLL